MFGPFTISSPMPSLFGLIIFASTDGTVFPIDPILWYFLFPIPITGDVSVSP